MKRVLLTSAAAIVALSTSQAMAAPGWYFAGAGAVNWTQDTSPRTALGAELETEFDTGWAVAATLGYGWSNGFRGELEVSRRENDVESVAQVPGAGAATGVDGNLIQFSFMANVLYDIPVDENFHLTLGAGAGLAEGNLDATAAGGATAVIRKNSGSYTFAWQLIGGAAYRAWGHTDVFAEYHYFANDGHDVVTFPGGFPRRDDIDADNHSIFLGLRFGFGE